MTIPISLFCNPGTISRNETAVREIANYAVDNGMYIILNLGAYNSSTWPWQFQLFKMQNHLG